MRLAHVPGDGLGREGVFADAVGLETRIGLQRGAECQVRGEGVVHVGDAARGCIIRRALGRADAADAAAVDLYEADLSVVDQLLGHVEVVGGFAACELHLAALCREARIGGIGAAEEGFLEPHGVHLLQKRDAQGGGLHVLAEDLARVDQQCAFPADALTRGVEMVAVVVQRTAAEGAPAAFHRAVAGIRGPAAAGERFLRRVAEELRGIRELGVGLAVAEELMDGCGALAAEQVPQRHLDSGEGVGGLEEVHAFHLDGGTHGGDVGGAVDLAAQHHVTHRLAGAMRHGCYEGGDGDERRGLALAPALVAISADADDERVLAAVADVLDLGHGEIEDVDGIDAHDGLAG